MKNKNRAVFIDRDGVINDVVDRGKGFFVAGKEVRFTAPYSLSEFQLKPNVPEALAMAAEIDFLRILITNQPDLAYNMMVRKDYDAIMAKMIDLDFNEIFICFHKREEGCLCKKPKPGMLLAAAEKWNIDFNRSYMVGDAKADILAGEAVGCKTILISTFYNEGVKSDFKAANLYEAIRLIQKIEGGVL